MSDFVSYLAILTPLLMWPVYGVFLWWLGYHMHARVNPVRGPVIQRAPGWLAWLCGVYPRVVGLPLTTVMAQLSALANVLAFLVLLAILLLFRDFLRPQVGVVTEICFGFAFFPWALYGIAEATLWAWKRVHGP